MTLPAHEHTLARPLAPDAHAAVRPAAGAAAPAPPPLLRDPRAGQIAALGALLAWGLAGRRFDLSPAQVALTLGAAQLAQWLGSRHAGLRYDPRSALISSLSLCLLLRTGQPWLGAVAALLAVGSKFALRVNGKHLLNPTNGALVLLLAAGAPMWVSPAQWGHVALFGFALACAGTLVVTRARTADLTLGFLAAWSALLVGRALWVGQPLAVPLHQLASGSLLLFAFFMISDPMTTPDSRAGRLVYVVAVALGAAFVQFVLFRPNGPLWSLAAASFLVPVLDRVLPGTRASWRALAAPSHPPTLKGDSDASPSSRRGRPRAAARLAARA